MTEQNKAPPINPPASLAWYRQFWPWFLITFPAAAVFGGIATIILAVVSDDGLVEDDYYKSGLAINKTLEREEAARELQLHAEAILSAEQGRLVLSLQGLDRDSSRLILKMIHPTIMNEDITVPLLKQADGRFSGLLHSAPRAGNWNLLLTPENNHWRLAGRISLPKDRIWKLTP